MGCLAGVGTACSHGSEMPEMILGWMALMFLNALAGAVATQLSIAVGQARPSHYLCETGCPGVHLERFRLLEQMPLRPFILGFEGIQAPCFAVLPGVGFPWFPHLTECN